MNIVKLLERRADKYYYETNTDPWHDKISLNVLNEDDYEGAVEWYLKIFKNFIPQKVYDLVKELYESKDAGNMVLACYLLKNTRLKIKKKKK